MGPRANRRARYPAQVVLDLVDHLDAMVAYWDADQICVFANQAYRDWFGKGRADVIGLSLRDLLGPALYAKNLPFIRAAYAGEKQVFEREIPTPSGTMRPSLATYTPRVVGGKVLGIYVHVADVTPLKALQHELAAAKERAEQLATHDFLTGLPNRRLLLDLLRHDLAAARRDGAPLAVLAIDLDNFKLVNDSHGHAAGDQFLVEIAARLRRSLRASDTVARMSGDEFLLLAPGAATLYEIEQLAERIYAEIRRPLQIDARVVVPALSIGVAIYPEDGSTVEALLAASDRALYAAKKLGKNRFALAAECEELH